LLARKRPDTFVGFDKLNRASLGKDFGINQNVGEEGYWDSMIERIVREDRPASLIRVRGWRAGGEGNRVGEKTRQNASQGLSCHANAEGKNEGICLARPAQADFA
jgi:hypothetical protein